MTVAHRHNPICLNLKGTSLFCVVLGLQMLVQPTNSASGATNAMPGLLRYPILGPYPFMLPMPMVAAPTGPVVQPVARESAPGSIQRR